MDKDTSEIAKLTERIAKDPRSKLFVPLAEEYKKAGDLEMSIRVLTEGLKNNPGYITAKSLLGRLLLEKGDLLGAQKEFEEVVKAIPENLIAQKKLGDVYALLGRTGDALKQYKTAKTLSPKDEEISSLISDLEAGRDIKDRLPKQKPQPVVSQETAQKPRDAAQVAQAKPVLAQGKAPSTPPAKGPQQAAAPVLKQKQEEEAPEDVLTIEPLEEPAVPGAAAAGGGFDFLAEADHGAVAYEEPPDSSFSFKGAPVEPSVEAAAGSPAAPEEAETPSPMEEAGVLQEKPKKSDDFTTDTLAELYLAQGFYEKTIEIYERMLADKPDSEGLKNKLAQVRALAAQAGPAAPVKEEKKSAPPEEGLETGSLSISGIKTEDETVEEGEGPVIEVEESDDLSLGEGMGVAEFLAPGEKAEFEPVEYKLAAPEKAEFEPVEYRPAAPEKAEFEPVEYKPLAPEPAVESKETIQTVSAGPTPSSRKQTIDRLEQWLSNIKKEK